MYILAAVLRVGFLEAMKNTTKGMETIGLVVQKIFEFKVLMYLLIPKPSIYNADRNKFDNWLNEFSQYHDLKGTILQVTVCKDEFLLVLSLLQDGEFQKLTGWEKVKSGTTRNVQLCVKMKSAVPFSQLKPFLLEHNIFIKGNQSLGDSAAEWQPLVIFLPSIPAYFWYTSNWNLIRKFNA
jgi:hypothetical protein